MMRSTCMSSIVSFWADSLVFLATVSVFVIFTFINIYIYDRIQKREANYSQSIDFNDSQQYHSEDNINSHF